MHQPSAVHSVTSQFAKIAFFTGVIVISVFSDILLDGLAAHVGDGFHRLTQELWKFCS